MWSFNSRFESSKRMNVAHASTSKPQACAQQRGKYTNAQRKYKRYPKPNQEPTRQTLSTNKGRPCDARVINPKRTTPSLKHQSPIPTPTYKPEYHQQKRQDHSNPPAWIIMSVFFHSWYMNSIDHDDLQLRSYTKQNLQYLSLKSIQDMQNKQRKS